MNLITPVILCGGSGTRLWPLSRKSLLQLTLERVLKANGYSVNVSIE